MTKQQAKAYIKEHGLYEAINSLQNGYNDNLKEVIFRVLDEIPDKVLSHALAVNRCR